MRNAARHLARYAVEGPPHFVFAFVLALIFAFALLTPHAHAQTRGLELTLPDTIHTSGIATINPSLRQRIITRLTDPNLAVLLIIGGALLIYLEFNIPGTVLPGTLGTLSVLLGTFGLSLLSVHLAAVAFIAAALILIVLEAKFASYGVLAISGIACLVFGLATLVDAPLPEHRVHLSTAIACGIGFGSISFFVTWVALRARRNKQLLGPQAMLRQTAIAITPLSPTGQVEVRGELWQARLPHPDSHAATGAALTVRAIDGLTLLVDPHPE